MKNKKKIGTALTALAEASVPFVKITKKGEYIAKAKKKGATHRIEETPLSVLAAPLKKWPKHKTAPEAAYGKPRIAEDIDHSAKSALIVTAPWHPPIPEGATWLEYTSGSVVVCEAIKFLHDYEGRRGTLRFGKLRYNDTFISLMPEDQESEKRVTEGIVKFNRPKEAKPSRPAPEVAQGAKSTPAAPKPAANDVPGLRQNGVRKPGAGGKTARVWDICDELLAKLKRTPTKAEVLAISVDKEGASPGMSGTQHSYWRRFYNHKLEGGK